MRTIMSRAAVEGTSSCLKSGEGCVQSMEDLVELFCAILHPLLGLAESLRVLNMVSGQSLPST